MRFPIALLTLCLAVTSAKAGESAEILGDDLLLAGCTECLTEGGDACGCAAGGCGDDCCGSCGCAAGSCGCGCATWAVGVDWMFLGRSVPDSHQALVECACAHPHDARFTANDFEPDAASGARIRAYRRCECGPDYEFTYLEMDEWSDSRYFAGDLTVLCCPVGTGTAYAHYDSTLRGFEFNTFTDCDCWTRFLVGIRWMQLDEWSEVGGTGTLGSEHHAVDTNNNFFGGQIGFNRLIWDNGGPWKVDLEVLTGLYANIIDVDRHFCACAGRQDTTALASISEIELGAAYAINCCWSVNVGAHFLWLSGVASAPEQYYYNHYIYDDSTAFFAGGSLGLTRVW